MDQKIDVQRYRASMSRLHEIFTGISETVNEVSTWRCPYKDATDRCTAKFGCRNQLRTNVVGELPICTGSDKLDYRSAWEV
ncbi:MAG: hypothetical protein O3A47_03770 [Chloroflexi bacterium]|nr:hypothetical protein [Chloroflexota bacterium]